MTQEALHLGFARKYRPQLFEDIVGQEAVAVTLGNAVASQRPAQAYLFFGPKGVGKTTAARILAKALNCAKGPAAKPCLKCPSCGEIAAGSSIDVLELDAASNTQVDKIREMIIETVSLAPSRDRYKVFIVDEAHMLSTSSFNALLKTLEEPPAHAVFILATTESAKIPATIVSRCHRFRFRPIPREVIAQYLARIAKAEKIAADKDALALLARAAGGALRDAVSLLDQAASYGEGKVTTAGVQELIGMLPEELLRALAAAVLAKDAAALTAALARVAAEGFDPTEVLRDLRERLQEAYLAALGAPAELPEEWRTLAAGQPPETFAFLLKRVNRTLADMRGADAAQIGFELGLYGLLESPYDLREWVRRLEALETRLGSGAAAAPPAPALGPAPAAPQPARAPEPAPIPTPAAAHGPVLPENVWPAVLQRLGAAKPSLAVSLGGSRLLPEAGDSWRLVFKQAFDKQRAESHLAEIEAELAAVAGRAVRLVLEVAAKKPAQPAPAPSPQAAAAPKEEGWIDSSEGDAAGDPGIQKVLNAFGGKVRPAKKK